MRHKKWQLHQQPQQCKQHSVLNCPKAVCSRVGAVPRQLHSIEKLESTMARVLLLLLLQVVVAKAVATGITSHAAALLPHPFF